MNVLVGVACSLGSTRPADRSSCSTENIGAEFGELASTGVSLDADLRRNGTSWHGRNQRATCGPTPNAEISWAGTLETVPVLRNPRTALTRGRPALHSASWSLDDSRHPTNGSYLPCSS